MEVGDEGEELGLAPTDTEGEAYPQSYHDCSEMASDESLFGEPAVETEPFPDELPAVAVADDLSGTDEEEVRRLVLQTETVKFFVPFLIPLRAHLLTLDRASV